MPSTARLVWDHVVHYVADIDVPVSVLSSAGLVACRGGSHTAWGTHNSLSFFGLTYIEFLGIEKKELVDQSKFLIVADAARLLPAQQTLYRVALRSSDINATHASLKSHGLQVSDVVDGRRTDTSGNLIEWRIFTIGGDYKGVPYPFVLQWLQSDEERLAYLRASGTDVPHPAGPVRMQNAIFRTTHPLEVRDHWRDVLGFAEGEANNALRAGEGQQFIFEEGKEERLAEVNFHADDTALVGKKVTVGQSSYTFV